MFRVIENQQKNEQKRQLQACKRIQVLSESQERFKQSKASEKLERSVSFMSLQRQREEKQKKVQEDDDER